MRHAPASLIGSTILLLCGCARLAAAETTTEASAQAAQLEARTVALFKTRCISCHNPRKNAGKLNLMSMEGLARGGESGVSVVAGKLDESLLWTRIAANEMPPEVPLSENELATVQSWIVANTPGLPDAATLPPLEADDGSDHWAFQPVARPAVPHVGDASRIVTDIDRFIQAALEARQLGLGPETDRATLIRRVSFDLTGLPPTVTEIATFLADPAPQAYERMVDRYLASPRYGERWGKHWLDAAGYADSNGYFNADSDRPLAYRYRDYVIRSINDDKPFDEFLREQIAGDELAGYQPDGDVTGKTVELLTATHFLRNGQDGTGESDGNDAELQADRFSVIEGNVQILSSALLGLTFQCARCHDHKFEPLSQLEYYRFQAILAAAYAPDEWIKPNDRVATIGARAEREERAAREATIDKQIELEKQRVEAAEPLRRLFREELVAALPADVREPIRAALATKAEERSDEQTKLLAGYEKQLEISDKRLAERFAEFAELLKSVKERTKELEAQRPAPLEQIAILADLAGPRPAHHVLVRGAYTERGDEAPPGVPAILSGPEREYQLAESIAGQCGTGRRSALAKWVTDPRHPLLARVTVNRIWQQHFGVGLVGTPDNFGVTGAPPSHPELLDYLAAQFVAEGWSLKQLHREMLKSAVYRQSGALAAKPFEIDPENRLLWRYPLRRLDSDQVRDAMLAVAGELDLTPFGPYVPTKRLPDGNVVVDEATPGAHRRSVYVQQRRTQILSLLEVFDAPAMVTNCTRRGASTIPLQSLSALNSDFVRARSKSLAERLIQEAPQSDAEKINLALLLCMGRSPIPAERETLERFLRQSREDNAGEGAERDLVVWQDACQMLLAGNAFLYVE